MATDPNIILQAGQINDPYRLAQGQMAQYQAMQAQEQMAGQNMLKKVFAQPGALTPDGQVSPNALAAVMKIDPQTGMDLAKQNRATMLDQLHIKAAELGNKMTETEIGKAKWDFITAGAAAATDAYDNAIKGGATPQMAMAKATEVRDQYLDGNGGQLSEDEEQKFKAQPFSIDQARALAGQNKDYLANKKEDERFGELVRHDKADESARSQELGIEQKRLEQDLWTATPDGMLLNKKTGEIRDPDQGGYFGSGSTGKTTGGLTPRKSNGGDNSDEVVDKKIDFIAAKLGVSPDDKLTPAQLVAFRSAYIQTEGSKTNNVGNLKNVSGAGFQTFPTKEAGLAAITAQISRDYARGQTSIRSLIEGVPQGGGGTGPVHGNAVEQSTAEALANYDIPFSARLESTRRGQKILALARQINPDFDQTDYAEKYKFKQGLGSSALGTSGGKIVSANTVMQHIALLDQLARNMHNGNIPAANSIANWFRTHTGQSQVTNFNLAKQFVVNETLKAAAGGVLTGEDRQTMLSNISSSGSWRQLSDAMVEMQQMIGAQMASVKQQYKAITKKDDFDHYLLPRTKYVLGKIDPEDFGGSSNPTEGWGKFTVVGN